MGNVNSDFAWERWCSSKREGSETEVVVNDNCLFPGRWISYVLADQSVHLLKGKLRLRQVTRRMDNGHQTPIQTSRTDLPAAQVACRMFERWRQENFFK